MKLEFDNIKKNNSYIIAPIALKEYINSDNYIYSHDLNFHPAIAIFLECSEFVFQVIDYKEVFINNNTFSLPLVKSYSNIEKGEYIFDLKHNDFSLACITLSDKGAVGLREDISGKTISEVFSSSITTSIISNFILPDNPERLRSLVLNLAHERQYDVIITTGGTGIAPSDQTPEALLPLLTRRFYGFEQIMMAKSFEKTSNALISRAFVGTIGNTFIISLPGSPKAVKENLEAIMPALPHALEKLHGSTVDCARL